MEKYLHLYPAQELRKYIKVFYFIIGDSNNNSVNWDTGEATRRGKVLKGIQMPWNIAYSKLTDKIYVVGTGSNIISNS